LQLCESPGDRLEPLEADERRNDGREHGPSELGADVPAEGPTDGVAEHACDVGDGPDDAHDEALANFKPTTTAAAATPAAMVPTAWMTSSSRMVDDRSSPILYGRLMSHEVKVVVNHSETLEASPESSTDAFSPRSGQGAGDLVSDRKRRLWVGGTPALVVTEQRAPHIPQPTPPASRLCGDDDSGVEGAVDGLLQKGVDALGELRRRLVCG
jgi:hypothetical protein